MTFNPFWKRALLQFGGFTVRGSQPFFYLFTYDGARRTDVAEVVHAAFTGVACAKERVYLALPAVSRRHAPLGNQLTRST